MPLPPRLKRNGNVYWFRCAIPRDIAATYPKTEEKFSLKTSEYQEALKKLRKASAEVDERFEEHRRQLAKEREPALPELTEQQIKFVGQIYYTHLLQEDEEVRESGFADRDFDEDAETTEALEAVVRRDYARGMVDEFMVGEAEEVLTWDEVGLKLEPTSPSWPKLARELQAAWIKASAAKRQRNEGTPVETPAVPDAKTAKAGKLLSVIIDEWIAEKGRGNGEWVASTLAANKLWAERFVEMAGDKPINEYVKADAREFKVALLKLPPNWTKNKEIGQLPMKDAAAKAAALGIDPMSSKNVNKVLGFLRALWNWAVANHDDVSGNPFDGLNVKISGKARDERLPFTTDELTKLFHAPIFTGCRSELYHNTAGTFVPVDHGIYWVPVLGLFTGCRSGEIIQLRLEDIRTDAGVTYFQVTDDGEDLNLKTAASFRRIPVHQTLVDLGFLQFVERQRKRKHKRLFPEMPKAKDGYYSTAYSTKFKNTLEALEIKHEKIAFHSFRHSFEDACRNSRIHGDFMNALQGHAEKGMAGRYGNGTYGLQLLNEEMQKLRYEGLDLLHLKQNCPASDGPSCIDASRRCCVK
ncbi:integrase [Sinorhizobium meliloti]|nr:tyrosine-type recombinase/integrase [Sinorhizobium meliloti]MDW9622918.1 tyrosine-type recombinase/integrase [Sinorhizobium meliloti]MDW9881271.1 tyrosine-type recombinase/integrase [Sinorhizobium meliloti]MDW9993631.1 tyrosine-type recombinase/integrase [Sinorhizobium meliloti]RVG01744.1 integrase [Sinorhizobium meliloti]